MTRWNELRELTRARVLVFIRYPETLFWVLMFPLLLATVLGYAFRAAEPAPSKVAVVAAEDQPGQAAEALHARLAAAERIELGYVDIDTGRRQVRKAALDVLVVPPAAPGAAPELILDPQREEAETARLRVLLALGEGPPEVRVSHQTEAGSRYIDFLFPGLLGANLMGTGMWLIGFTVAELRQKKLLKRMLVTPMRRSSFLLSFMLSRLCFFVFEMAALVTFGALVLDVPFRAGVLGFGLLCLFGATVFAGLGMMATARARTIQGASGLLNVFMMPMWLLSGVFFSYERFPEALHPILRVLPLSALNDGLRALMIDGVGLAAIGPELAILAAWCAVSFAVALRFFRWE
ncbi:ABC transporter permease [Haliangium sp.]|uniref:ABC transporter permease n=1 Tax=Haliangium sp. TaxID=2663208 RepID=UPI003D0DF25A